jgi:hypothetical protein
MRNIILLLGLCVAALVLGVGSAVAIKGGHVPVTICHKPGPAEQTITVDQSAVAAHLAHGDYLGPCYSGTTTDPPTTTEDAPPVTTTTDPGEGNESSPHPGPTSNPEDLNDGDCPDGTTMVLDESDDVEAPLFTCVGTTGGTAPTSGDLPYTGVPVWVMFLVGIGFLAGGLWLLGRK